MVVVDTVVMATAVIVGAVATVVTTGTTLLVDAEVDPSDCGTTDCTLPGTTDCKCGTVLITFTWRHCCDCACTCEIGPGTFVATVWATVCGLTKLLTCVTTWVTCVICGICVTTVGCVETLQGALIAVCVCETGPLFLENTFVS